MKLLLSPSVRSNLRVTFWQRQALLHMNHERLLTWSLVC
jgi:hypothetical protein